MFKRTVGDGAVDELPGGHDVVENVNGLVSLRRARPRLITEAEDRVAREALDRYALRDCMVEIKDRSIVIHCSDVDQSKLKEVLARLGMGGEGLLGRLHYSPILRFTLEDDEERGFIVQQMTFRGDGGWSYPLDAGDLEELLREYLPHIGRDSFYELY